MGLFTVTVPRRDKDDVSHIICVRSGQHTQTAHNRHISSNWHTAGQILDNFLTIYVPVFKMFIFTVVEILL